MTGRSLQSGLSEGTRSNPLELMALGEYRKTPSFNKIGELALRVVVVIFVKLVTNLLAQSWTTIIARRMYREQIP
jgi:hypothetical protein